MRISIITKIGRNFGALLQAYALKTAFEKRGNSVSVVRYELESTKRTYSICNEPWHGRGIVSNLKSLVHFKEYKSSISKFLSFRDKHFGFERSYSSYKEISDNPPISDIYITGSDQVWNPFISFDPAYYCSFVPEGSAIASYAASIGVAEIPGKYKDEFIERVNKFDFISVREKSAKNILEKYGIDSQVAPDPTFLLDEMDWDNIAKQTIEPPYILCYFVTIPTYAKQLVNDLSKKLHIPVVNIMNSEAASGIGNINLRDCGPEEFVGLFKSAQFVITSSFHGTAFSIIFRKPFITTLYKKTGSRVKDLLSALGLEQRIVECEDINISDYTVNSDTIYGANFTKCFSKYINAGLGALDAIEGIVSQDERINKVKSRVGFEKKFCTGCGLCKSLCPKKAIEMEYDIEGFLYPTLNYEKCVGCNICMNNCPFLRDVLKQRRL